MDTSDLLLPLHLLTLTFVAWTALHADHMGFKWILGREQTLDKETTEKFHTRIWIGLGGMILTGFLMFWPMREYLLSRPQFYAKMFFVLALVANGFAIGSLQKVAFRKSFKELTTKERVPLLISGAVSTISWIGAATLAFFLVPEY